LFVEAEVNAIAIDVDANQIGPPGRTIWRRKRSTIAARLAPAGDSERKPDKLSSNSLTLAGEKETRP
jgi:hypothetical protein